MIYDDLKARGITPIVIRTSDRNTYRQCRRLWDYSSALRRNLTTKETPSYFWLGTGGHFALEDFHGYCKFEHPVEAFRAYTAACSVADSKGEMQLPDDYMEQQEVAEGVLSYYLTWLSTRKSQETYWIDGKPQVEVRVALELPIKSPLGIPCVYDLTLDRVIIEEDGSLGIVDYKFVKTFRNEHIDIDPQITAYMWAGHTLYNSPTTSFTYHQFRKEVPRAPKVLQNGRLSSAKDQLTTYTLYREALIRLYGEVEDAPMQNVATLNYLNSLEDADRDKFITRLKTYRNQHQLLAESDKILMETSEMINPHIPIYPSPSDRCSWGCDFRDVCIMQDCGEDFEGYLLDLAKERPPERDAWRKYIKWPT